ncbi:DUF3016 domain-containing protein [Uliginosibacterium sp. H1]|uniref:DUF3016 domain-containing protein n=1 Tax=Uliginosibacterium sp. H1 TaxID=3114757 RepID=UPI002E19C1DD|nr:DUF3016 domain-containing protein [Uliginosibacterium sp. H1]
MDTLALLRTALCAACLPLATAAAESGRDGAVQVRYEQPEGFTESRRSFESERQRSGWLTELARHVEKRAAVRLADGQRLEITVTDIDRAGETELWRGGAQASDLRIVRDLYPPRIDLHFVLRDAQGGVLRQGERRLRDIDFMSRPGRLRDDDRLRYEKALLDDWLDREFGRAG